MTDLNGVLLFASSGKLLGRCSLFAPRGLAFNAGGNSLAVLTSDGSANTYSIDSLRKLSSTTTSIDGADSAAYMSGVLNISGSGRLFHGIDDDGFPVDGGDTQRLKWSNDGTLAIVQTDRNDLLLYSVREIDPLRVAYLTGARPGSKWAVCENGTVAASDLDNTIDTWRTPFVDPARVITANQKSERWGVGVGCNGNNSFVSWNGTKRLQLWTEDRDVQDPVPVDMPEQIEDATFDSSGKELVILLNDGRVAILNSADRGGNIYGAPVTDRFARFWLSPKGSLVYRQYGPRTGTSGVYTSRGRLLWNLNEWPSDIAFSINEQLMAISLPNNMELLDLTSSKPIGTIDEPFGRASFDNDGRRLAVLKNIDRHSIDLWDTSTQTRLGEPFGFADRYHAVVLSGDGEYVIGMGDGGPGVAWAVGATSVARLACLRNDGILSDNVNHDCSLPADQHVGM
jgi:WD40 repeat protein